MTPTEIKAAVDHYSRQLVPNGKGDLTYPTRIEVGNFYRMLKDEESRDGRERRVVSRES